MTILLEVEGEGARPEGVVTSSGSASASTTDDEVDTEQAGVGEVNMRARPLRVLEVATETFDSVVFPSSLLVSTGSATVS